MRKVGILFSLVTLLSLTSCNEDTILNNIINLKNRLDYLNEHYDTGRYSYYPYYQSYDLSSFLKTSDNYELLNIKGDFELEMDYSKVKNRNGYIEFNLINGEIESNLYSSLYIKIVFKFDTYIDISYIDNLNPLNNMHGTYFLEGKPNITFDFSSYLIDLDNLINEAYLNLKDEAIIDTKLANYEEISGYTPLNEVNISLDTFLSIYRDVKENDNLLNKGKVYEYVSYFDLIPFVPFSQNKYYFKNGWVKELARRSNYEDNLVNFNFNESLKANQETFYNLVIPSSNDRILINNNLDYFTNINLGYKSNLRDIVEMLKD